MRAFLAVDFSKEMKDGIAAIQSELRQFAVSGRWKYIDNFHLTLKFLDEVDERKKTDICNAMKEVCFGKACFNLHISQLGSFPGLNCYRVLWLGLDGELERLRELQKEIDKGFSSLGFQIENRSYTPHVTIAQNVVFRKSFDDIRKTVDFKDFPIVHIDRLYLFKSEQIGVKRVYTPVSEFKFC